jgi:chromosome segregation ATPase
MPTEYVIWIVVAGVVGLVVGFVAGYFLLRNSVSRHRGELMSLRSAHDEKHARLEEAEQKISALNRRLEEKDTQLRTAHDEIHHLESRLEDKAQRERKAMEALREVVKDEAVAVENRPTELDAEARRRAESRRIAEEERRIEEIHDVRRK